MKKAYGCKEARKDVRFIYSKKAEEHPQKIKNAFERFIKHALRRGNGKGMIFCHDCLNYHEKIKVRHGF